MRKKRSPSIKKVLIAKSREAALQAVQAFNNSFAEFKSETFIVLMNIAWTYLLHAYYREKNVEYRRHTIPKGAKRRKFIRVEGSFVYWSLRDCLQEATCPLDSATKSNINFFIGLRNKIVHHMPVGFEHRYASRYLAFCLNYERYLCELFGEKYSLKDLPAYTVQFRDITTMSSIHVNQESPTLPSSIAEYIQEFDANLPDKDYESPNFKRRFCFMPIVANRRGQADTIVEFIEPDSELAKLMNDRTFVAIKETEKPKYLPKKIVEIMHKEGYTKFSIYRHTQLWQNMDGKNSGKGYGVQVLDKWYWYERWVDVVREHCKDNEENIRTKN